MDGLTRAARTRPYWMALAHCIVAAKPDTARMVRLNAQFIELSIADKLACRAEIRECKRAMRGEVMAEIHALPSSY